MTLCEGNAEDCTGVAVTMRDTSSGHLAPEAFCAACAAKYDRWIDNYDPPDPDGEDLCRDYQAEARDAADAARRLK